MSEFHEYQEMETPREGWVLVDGKVYGTADPEMLQSAKDHARTEAFKCGQLYDAVSENNMEDVKKILCWDDKSSEKIEFRKWYVNEKSWNDWRCLHASSEAGFLEITQMLVECGAEINALNNVKYTALHLAASKGRSKIVKLLLEHGANVSLHTEAGLNGTALHFAAGNGHYDCVRELVTVPNHEELVNAVSGDYNTALHLAVVGQFIDIVKLLLESGAKKVINEGDWDSQTALHSAVLTGNLELVKLLVEVGGANVNVQDQMGRTPSRRAKEICKMDIMKFLEEQ